MRIFRNLLAGALVVVSGLHAQNPAPAAVINPASNVPPALSQWGIAQGSIFVVYPAFDTAGKVIGGSLGPATIAQAQTLPLTTNLGGTTSTNGTSIKITIGNAPPVDAFIVYTLSSQVAAVLPSTTPLGTGTLTLTYNGNSGSTPIRVVASRFGISTVDQSGAGTAVVTFPNYQLVDSAHSAKPGDVLVMWGTGLGAANNDAAIATSGDLGTPINVWLGEVQATIQYRGRSASPGLDQINFTVPDGVSPGCAVSLVVVIPGQALSNTTTIPVMPAGGACSDPVLTGIPATTINSLLSKSTVKLTVTDISQSNSLNQNNTPTFSAKIKATFASLTQSQFGTILPQVLFRSAPSPGSCVIFITQGSQPNGGNNGGTADATFLDAGAAVTLTPPTGSALSAPGSASQKGVYQVSPTSALPAGIWTESNGTGGADVPPFSANLTFPQPVVWSNPTAAFDHTQFNTVKWTGGDPNGYVSISGSSGFGNSTSFGSVAFQCSAPTSAGQFVIPPWVLTNLPTTATQSSSVLQIDGYNTGAFSVPGFDAEFMPYHSSNQYIVSWK